MGHVWQLTREPIWNCILYETVYKIALVVHLRDSGIPRQHLEDVIEDQPPKCQISKRRSSTA